MPGIHVRSLGKLDWVERGNEPVLTVPGAYWLCHKKHIYKFTFKWHKTLRNTEGFAYPKELTKVIRRIIKSQPRQGQQFGTRHLLVTYNHSAWMRQDKMFAMLKFQDRSEATAFPHAFVLTVKTLENTSAEELRPAHQNEDPTLTCLESAKNSRLQDTKKGNNVESSANVSHDNESFNRHTDTKSKDQIEIFAKATHSEKSTAASSSFSQDAENDRKKDPGKKSTKRPRAFDKIESPSISKKRNQQERTTDNKESLVEKEIADSADLPYQYIIEKEIENSKSAPEATSPGPSNRERNNSIKSLPRSPRIAIADTARSSDITDLVMEGLMFTIRQDKDSITVVEQKTKLEMDEVLENSEKAETKEGEKCLVNSSLLRLENLITKIEMSEARLKSNEEKSKSPLSGNDRNIDKPLPNNSSSTNSEYSLFGGKFDAKMFNDSPLIHEKSTLLSPTPELPKFPLVKINLNNVRNVLSDALSIDEEALNSENKDEAIEVEHKNEGVEVIEKIEEKNANEVSNEVEEEEDEVGLELKYEEKDEDEIEAEDEKLREDIVPEVLQENQSEELLMDDSETEETSKNHDPSSTPIKDCIETMKSKTPRVISNELVTDDQIPPELQRALRYKRSRRLFSSEMEKTVKNDDKIAMDDKTTEMKSPVLLPIEKEAQEKKPQEIVTVDLTEEFDRELASGKSRKQPTRRKSLRHVEQSSSDANQTEEQPEIHIEMWKFIQDITRGAKVVVHRLDLANIPNCIVTDSSLQKYNSSRRYATES